MHNNDDLLDWSIFTTLYECRSIQKTAEILGLETPHVSKKLSQLEIKLGRHLFDRTHRPFKPTEDANGIITYAREMLEQRHKIDRFYAEMQNEQTHVLRVMIGNSYRKFAPKLVSRAIKLFPNLRINLISPNDINDFITGKSDIINISGNLDLPNAVFIPRGKMLFVPVASPKYIDKYGPINSPNELSKHRVFSNLYKDRYSFFVTYQLKKDSLAITHSGNESIRWSSADMVKEAVLDGLGIATGLPLFHCIEELENGTLVPILNGWHRPSQPNWVCCKKDDWSIKYIRLFATWWADELAKVEADAEKRLALLFGNPFLSNLNS